MKAELDESGTLRIQAETALESYALDRWSERYAPATGERDSVLLIETKLDMQVEPRALIARDEAPKNFLTELMRAIDRAERHGSAVDIPEGARYIRISDTLASRLSAKINRLLLDAVQP